MRQNIKNYTTFSTWQICLHIFHVEKFLHVTEFPHIYHLENFLYVKEFLHQSHVEKFSTWQICLHISHVEKFLHVTEFPHMYHVEKFSTWQHVMGRISPHDQFFLHRRRLWRLWQISGMGNSCKTWFQSGWYWYHSIESKNYVETRSCSKVLSIFMKTWSRASPCPAL